MVIDRWRSGNRFLNENEVDMALDEFNAEEEALNNLVDKGNYWDAYIRLTSVVSFVNYVAEHHSDLRDRIITKLLDWIRKMKGLVDSIVKRVGGVSYSIGVSAPFGVSISVSFSVD